MLRLSLFVFLCCAFGLIEFSQGSVGTKGECPSSGGRITICLFDPKTNCISQNQCPDGYKCCRYGCGSICRAVTEPLNHPGYCPATVTVMGKACNTDEVCNANEKCCNRRCVVVRPSSVPVIGDQ